MYEKMDSMARELDRLYELGREEDALLAPLAALKASGGGAASAALGGLGLGRDEWDNTEDCIFEDTTNEDFERNLLEVCRPMPWDLRLLGQLGEECEDLLSEDYDRIFKYFRNKHVEHDQQLISQSTADRRATKEQGTSPSAASTSGESLAGKKKPRKTTHVPLSPPAAGGLKSTMAAMKAGGKMKKAMTRPALSVETGSATPSSAVKKTQSAPANRNRFASNTTESSERSGVVGRAAVAARLVRTTTRMLRPEQRLDTSADAGSDREKVQLPALPGATPRDPG